MGPKNCLRFYVRYRVPLEQMFNYTKYFRYMHYRVYFKIRITNVAVIYLALHNEANLSTAAAVQDRVVEYIIIVSTL